MLSTKAIAFALIHHCSTALFALQQCLDTPPVVAFPPSQHDTLTMDSRHATTAPCSPACPCADPCAKAPRALRENVCVYVCVGGGGGGGTIL